MIFSEIHKIINAMPPHSTDGGLLGVAAYVNMENYSHLTVIVQQGVGAAATITIEKSATGVGAGTAIVFNYRLCDTAYQAAAGDLLGDLTAAGVGGIATGATDNSFLVIELDAVELGAAYPYVRADASSVAGVIGMIYILSGARYQEPTPTALTV